MDMVESPAHAGMASAPAITTDVESASSSPLSQAQPQRARARAGGLRWRSDSLYHGVSLIVALSMVVVLAAIVVVLATTAAPAIGRFGAGFLVGAEWNSTVGVYGALPFIAGTAITTALALLLAVPVSLGIALFLVEYAPAPIAATLGVVIDVAAGVPTVVFGAWALLAVVPWLRDVADPALAAALGWLPLFAMPPIGYLSGYGMLAAGLVLSAMVFPTIVGVTRGSLLATPLELREASLAVGATRWETATRVVLRQARPGVLGAIVLACGRAVGETMAVATIIGNAPALPHSLFDQGSTLATELFNQVYGGNASPGTLTTAALYELAIILLALSALTSLAGRLLTRGLAGDGAGGAR
jgi:phosphate transport system permease protein